MQILIAPDKFKGSLTAVEVCDAIEDGLIKYDSTLQIQKLPLADGGEGSLEILAPHLQLEPVSVKVQDPLGRTITASYMVASDTAFIEMSAASGLELLAAEERHCMITSSRGTGQMMLDAYDKGIKNFVLFVGGSATNDGGIGILDALGVHAFGAAGPLSPVGKSLPEITGFDDSGCLVKGIEVTVVCDVQNPLFGPQGAAFVYAPQKGATPHELAFLDDGLQNMAHVVKSTRNISIDDFPGAGAAGGVAAGIKAFFPIKIQSGFGTIMQIVGLEAAVDRADLVITGEGKFDHQTLQGKVVKGVYDLCQQASKPLAVICGVLDLEQEELEPLDMLEIKPLVNEKVSIEQAQANAFQLVSQRAFELLEATQPLA